MNKTIYIRRENIKEMSDALRGKYRTMICEHFTDDADKIHIYGIGMKDWLLAKKQIQKIAIRC